MTSRATTEWIGRHDGLLISLLALLLFASSTVGNRPLTMHEARLPQTAGEMKARGDWLLPTSGSRPWLERPPLPHWIVIACDTIAGRDQSVAVVRLPSAIAGAVTVLIAFWLTSQFFGRGIARLTAAVLATTLEFFRYATLAEDDIYLACIVTAALAIFARMILRPPGAASSGGQPRWMMPLAFFALVGLSNWAKGPLVGPLIIGSAIAAFLLWRRPPFEQWRRLLWPPGWIIAIGLTIAWPIYAYRAYPDVLENWKVDYLGRVSGTYTAINQGWYYYLVALATAMIPWTPAAILGLWATARAAWRRRTPNEQFIWCWALAPLLVLSIPQGKHHHYLLPLMVPWATLAAIGAREFAGALFRSGRLRLRAAAVVLGIIAITAATTLVVMHNRFHLALTAVNVMALIVLVGTALIARALWLQRSALLAGGFIGTVAAILACVEICFTPENDRTRADTVFVLRSNNKVPREAPLFINSDVDTLDFFRLQFYARADAHLLHNLTFLRARDIAAPLVYVITRRRDEARLAKLGRVECVDVSERSHNDAGLPAGRFALFRLSFAPDLVRYDRPMNITNMQALSRAPGPFCGPPLEGQD